MKKVLSLYCTILIACSSISFFGHFIQFGVIRSTPWIPAVFGTSLILLNRVIRKNRSINILLFAFLIFCFGVLTGNMFLTFLPQEFQPIRKKVVFLIMSFMSFVTIGILIKESINIKKPVPNK